MHFQGVRFFPFLQFKQPSVLRPPTHLNPDVVGIIESAQNNGPSLAPKLQVGSIFKAINIVSPRLCIGCKVGTGFLCPVRAPGASIGDITVGKCCGALP